MSEPLINEDIVHIPALIDDNKESEEIDSIKLINIIPGALIGSVIFVVVIRLYDLVRDIYDNTFGIKNKDSDISLSSSIYLFLFILALSILIILFIIWCYL